MKIRLFTLFGAIALTLALAASSANAGLCVPGTGTCPSPWMQDADGDGIPNGQDPDYVRPLDGTGSQYRRGALPASAGNTIQNQWREFFRDGWRGLAGTFGFGPGTGTGVCDGTGPKGFGGLGRH